MILVKKTILLRLDSETSVVVLISFLLLVFCLRQSGEGMFCHTTLYSITEWATSVVPCSTEGDLQGPKQAFGPFV